MKTLADIKKIAVLGAGTMGPGIAQTYAIGGYNVTMWTRSEATREKAKATLHSSLETFAEEGEIKESEIEEIYGRVNFKLTVEEAIEISFETGANHATGTSMRLFAPLFSERYGFEYLITDVFAHLGDEFLLHIVE